MRRASAFALAVLIAAVLIGGCGGHAATRTDVIARANAICFGAQQAVRSIASTGAGATDTKARATYFNRVTRIVAKEASQLAALPRPKQRRGALNRYVDAVDASVGDYRAAGRAATAGDAGGVSQALAKLQSNRATRYARDYGLKQCAGSASPAG